MWFWILDNATRYRIVQLIGGGGKHKSKTILTHFIGSNYIGPIVSTKAQVMYELRKADNERPLNNKL